jgi:transcriptional regulator with XRE-family HTH domain
MITGSQIRGARAMIRMSIEDLSMASGLEVSTLRLLEDDKAIDDPQALLAASQVLENAGVIFLSSGNQDEGGPGLRLKTRTSMDSGIRPEELNATNDD